MLSNLDTLTGVLATAIVEIMIDADACISGIFKPKREGSENWKRLERMMDIVKKYKTLTASPNTIRQLEALRFCLENR